MFCSKTDFLWRAQSLRSFLAKCASLDLSIPLRLLSQGLIDRNIYSLALTCFDTDRQYRAIIVRSKALSGTLLARHLVFGCTVMVPGPADCTFRKVLKLEITSTVHFMNCATIILELLVEL
jgi:hypothetical protein